MTSFYSEEELSDLGFKSIGKNVQLSRRCSIYGASRISIGNNVRIDDFTVISAGMEGIELGSHIHISPFCSMQGNGKIIMEDFSGLSSRVSIYSSNDDYFGNFLTNPTIPAPFTGVKSAPVILKKHALVGSGAVLLPKTILNEGTVIGALSLVKGECEAFYIYKGNPAQKVMERSRKLLEIENQYIEFLNVNSAL
jgi:acetyltransferase-like isoleucine patch superfamily enzyme